MKKLISLKLALVILLSSLSSFGPISIAAAATSSCENGECIERLIDKLEDLGKVYSRECLPSQGSKTPLKTYHEENGLTEQCWKLVTEINHLEAELQRHQTKLEERLGCQGGDCKLANPGESLNSQISELTKVEQNLSCTIPKKQAIKAQCPSDMNCVLAATAMGVGGYLAELLVPANAKPKGCHLGDDSCLTQLATGFLKAAISFFEGAWDLLKIVGKKAGQKMKQFWNWVSGAENHSSTSQLAMAKASKDAGVFDMLVNDFPGTMKKIWSGFVGSMKEWLKTDIFCQKWSGVPHFSTCQKPTESFDCIPCKTMVSGLCAVTGTLVAEVVPSFLTGGLITAAKHGANGAVKIAKMFRISNKGIKAIKASRVAKIAVSASTKVDDVLRLSKGLKVAKTAITIAMSAISRYMLSPTRKAVKSSLAVLTAAMKKGTAYVAVTPVGKTIVFSGKALKMTGKVILYPIDNPMTTWAYKAGERSFDKIFKLGAPKLASQGAVVTTMISNEKGIQSLLAKVEEAKIVKPKAKDLLRLEQELLEKIGPKRQAILMEALKDDSVNLEDVIKHLYPELQYGDLAKKLTPQQILAAEKELWLEISKMPDGPAKTVLTKRYNSHVIQGEARLKVVGDSSPTYKQIIDNSNLNKEDRLREALKLLKREGLDPEDKASLARALEEAHLSGPDNGVFEYSWAELREKYRILTDGGFTKDEADILIRSGLAGRPPVRELIKPGDTLFSGFAEDIVDANYLKQRDELIQLIKDKTPDEKKGILQKFTSMFKTPVPKSDIVVDNFDSLYFVDYRHSVDELDNFMSGSKQVSASSMSAKYEEAAFKNFKDTRTYLLTEKPPLNKDTFIDIHRRMMKGGIEGIEDSQLGKFRSAEVYGNVPEAFAIDAKVKKEIMENPYLTWVESGVTNEGKFYGGAHYPNVTQLKKEGLDLIRKNHKELALQIEEYQTLPAKLREFRTKYGTDINFHLTPEGEKMGAELAAMNDRWTELSKMKLKLNENLVEAMVDDLMDWFTRERTLIGEINSPEKLDQYVNLLAKYQRDLVSIHPFRNGNGRSTREFALSYALMKEGFPPPRILDPNADIYTSLDEWKKVIKHGILASDFLVDDMVERLKFGLPIENSVELITPYTRPPVKMTLKGQKKVPYMEGVEYIDPRLYREIIKREIAANPALKVEFQENPVAAWDKIHKKAEEIFAKNNLYYNHPKKGIERVALGIVDEDFKILYGKASFENKELFDFKMKTWYSEDITWRGLASKHAEKSEGEIINMFEELTSHNASNAVLKKVGGNATPETIKKAALEDFDKYNSDVFGDGLVQMAKDHSETGPMYGISYGYSTSKNREVGKAFAMGAMVVGEYGSHKAPELQALLKSRVLVGARRAHKDVDLGRLKQLKDEFSYKYGRQQEVMGIGASDPDAITIVQTIDAEGEVMLTYLRNKKNPKEILVIKGDIDPDAVPKPEQIVKTIKLGSN